MKDRILKQITGDRGFTLRHKVLNAIFFILGIYLFITALTNLFIEENLIIRAGTFFASGVFFISYYFARVKRVFALGHFIAVLTILLLFVYHKYDGGIGCGTGFYIVITAIGIISIFRGKPMFFYLIALCTVSAFLVVTEIFVPGYVASISVKTCFVNNILAFILTGTGAGLILYVFANTYESYAMYREKQSLTDHLTGMLNRRAFLFELKKRIPLLLRRDIPFCLVMFDCDDFKKINDTYGHSCGDTVLVELAEKISSLLKTGDMLCRWGGEEFMIFLPYADEKQGIAVAERLRKAVEKMKVVFEGVRINLTITLGVREFSDRFTLARNIEFADLSMYKGKRLGKNVVVAG